MYIYGKVLPDSDPVDIIVHALQIKKVLTF